MTSYASAASQIQAFISYDHATDDDLQFVEPLHISLVKMIKATHGRDVQIFRDKTGIRWGDPFQDAIKSGLTGASVLFVIATVAYLESENCRDEFNTFLNAANASGSKDLKRLILPIMPINAPKVFNVDAEDTIAREIAKIQYEQIEDAVLDGPGSPTWKHAMVRLAHRFVEVVEAAEAAIAESSTAELKPASPKKGLAATGTSSDHDNDEEDSEDDRGIMDAILDIHDDLAEVTNLAENMTANMTAVTTAASSVRLDNVSDPRELGVKLRTIAAKMSGPSSALGEEGAQMRDRVNKIDVSLRRMIMIQVELDNQPKLMKDLQEISDNLQVINGVDEQMEALLNSMRQAELASSAVRRSLQPMRSGLTAFRDAARIIKQWGPQMVDDIY
ncbi:toll/interleukin-1 receptor domain-containing protein [uncultured Arthrobacter sp.]|uniref:toll/interleukin-1 receptor domain-containing protein n=1 Tax=uncultured Arthrobacter sp. TaxID=114050 RepID=UPI0026298E6F|nr:toll/interleukin-1 receptor domain-containing protein [uncultured Arthrobacter sp.]